LSDRVDAVQELNKAIDRAEGFLTLFTVRSVPVMLLTFLLAVPAMSVELFR